MSRFPTQISLYVERSKEARLMRTLCSATVCNAREWPTPLSPSAAVHEWSFERKLSFLYCCTRNQRRRNGSIPTGYCLLFNSQRECGIIYIFLVTLCLYHLTTVQCRPRVRYSCTGFTLGNKQFSVRVMIRYVETSTLIFSKKLREETVA